MPVCEHKYKKRIYGPFSQETIGEKLICGDCLETLSVTDKSAMPERKAKARVTITDENRLDWAKLIDGLSSKKLGDWDQGFFDSFRERFERYGPRTTVSDKQQAILDRLQAQYLSDYTPPPPTTKELMKEVSRNAPPMTNDGFRPGEDDIPF